MTSRTRLGEILIDRGLLSEQQLVAALADQGESREPLGRVLVRHGVIDHTQLTAALGEQMRRWIAAGITASFVVAHPGLALARIATAPLTVSVEVLGTAAVAAHPPPAPAATTSGSVASMSLTCGGAPILRVTLDRASIEPVAPAPMRSIYVPQAPYRVTLQPITSSVVPCAKLGDSIGVAVPVSKSSGDNLNVEIAY